LLEVLLDLWVEQQLLLLRPQLCLLQLQLLLPADALHCKAAGQEPRLWLLLLLLLEVLLLQGQLLQLQLLQLVWQQGVVGVGYCLQPLTNRLCGCTRACI
jgi:hypothetical protein